MFTSSTRLTCASSSAQNEIIQPHVTLISHYTTILQQYDNKIPNIPQLRHNLFLNLQAIQQSYLNDFIIPQLIQNHSTAIPRSRYQSTIILQPYAHSTRMSQLFHKHIITIPLSSYKDTTIISQSNHSQSTVLQNHSEVYHANICVL